MKVFEQAVEFIRNLTRAEKVEKEQRLREDLNMSEEDVMEVILDLEEAYSLDDLTLEEFEKIETVESLVGVIEQKVKVKEEKEGNDKIEDNSDEAVDDNKETDVKPEKDEPNPEDDKSQDEDE